MVSALGGPANFVEDPERYLPKAPIVRPFAAGRGGYLAAVDGRRFGYAIIELGGGRRMLDDTLDLSVGFTDVLPIGSLLEKDTPIMMVHARDEDSAEAAERLLRDACTIDDAPPDDRPVVLERLATTSVEP